MSQTPLLMSRLSEVRRANVGAHRLVSFLVAFVCILVLTFSLRASAAATSLFVFGDEYVDTGSSKYFRYSSWKCQNPPYGQNTELGNGRCSDGLLVIDLLAKQLRLSSPGTFYGPDEDKKQGTNFAFAGAGVLATTNPRITFGLEGQWNLFKFFLSKNKGIDLRGSIFVISFGMNDYVQALLNGEDPVGVTDKIVPRIAQLIADVQAKTGAYRFLVLTPPPIGCLPLIREKFHAPANSCLTNLNALNDNHDSRTSLILDALAAAAPNGAPLYYSRFSMASVTLDPRSGFIVFTRPWDLACGTTDTVSGEMRQCGQEISYRDPMQGGKIAMARIMSARMSGYDYWWWDWVNPTQNANYMMWVNMWRGTNCTYPITAEALYLK